jgi:hypothetical protein
LKASEVEAKVNLNAEIDAIVAEAQAQSKRFPEKNKSERVSNIKENRRNEREAMQTAAITKDALKPPNTPASPDVDDGMSPIMRKIKRKAEERLKNE